MEIKLKSSSDAFYQMMGSCSSDIKNIDISQLVPFENQPFKPYKIDRLEELAKDIKFNGVLSPILVRPLNDGWYQILAGHNRVEASKLAGLETVPAIVKDVDDIVARLIMLTTNLNQREELLHSEKALAYKMQMEILEGATSCRTSSKLSEEMNINKRQIQRFIRLTYLITEFLDMVDERILPFMAGVSLSYIDEENQESIYQFIEDNSIKNISVQQAEDIKALQPFNLYKAYKILKKEKENNKPRENKEKTISLKIPFKYFPKDIKSFKLDDDIMQQIATLIINYSGENNEQI